jgi:hypothetical protein
MKKLLSFVPAFAARALACHIFPLERLVRGWQVGPLMTKINSSPDQWAGRTTLDSGSATVTVSTRIVNSDSLIWVQGQNHANVASGTYKPVEVRTISPGNFFTLGTADGIAMARDTTLMWEVKRAS